MRTLEIFAYDYYEVCSIQAFSTQQFFCGILFVTFILSARQVDFVRTTVKNYKPLLSARQVAVVDDICMFSFWSRYMDM